MEFITNILYWISTGLMIPVTLLLIYFFLSAVIMIGGFYGAYIARNKTNVKINRALDTEDAMTFMSTLEQYNTKNSTLIQSLTKIKGVENNNAMIDKIIGDYEIIADKELAKSKRLVKIGPMLGLMGTLIPMGPALVGLATGDIASMASNMQVAFATTVIGVIIGAIGFITLQVRQNWVADDMNILDYIAESLKK
ncbi:MAG: MotA/TolQ/ExbB proton channel family protein [bacterium]